MKKTRLGNGDEATGGWTQANVSETRITVAGVEGDDGQVSVVRVTLQQRTTGYERVNERARKSPPTTFPQSVAEAIGYGGFHHGTVNAMVSEQARRVWRWRCLMW
jgi:hypothetical protein